jgi:hypothetical protein
MTSYIIQLRNQGRPMASSPTRRVLPAMSWIETDRGSAGSRRNALHKVQCRPLITSRTGRKPRWSTAIVSPPGWNRYAHLVDLRGYHVSVSVRIMDQHDPHLLVGLARIESKQRRSAVGRDRVASGWPGTTFHHDRSHPDSPGDRTGDSDPHDHFDNSLMLSHAVLRLCSWKTVAPSAETGHE